MSTYFHSGKWLTEVRINKTTSFSRPATPSEIPKIRDETPPETQPEEIEVKRSPGRPRKNQ